MWGSWKANHKGYSSRRNMRRAQRRDNRLAKKNRRTGRRMGVC